MDILKTLITAIPTSGLLTKVTFFVIGTTLLAWYTFGYVPAEHQRFVQSKEKIQAVSWYLGWNTIALLIPNWLLSKQTMPSMDAYLEVLEISLEKPSSYYLENSGVDNGARAQTYKEQVFAKIKAKHGKDVANYYGVATNLLQAIAPYQSGSVPPEVQRNLQEHVCLLKLPPELSQVPSEGLLLWCNKINDYFEKRL